MVAQNREFVVLFWVYLTSKRQCPPPPPGRGSWRVLSLGGILSSLEKGTDCGPCPWPKKGQVPSPEADPLTFNIELGFSGSSMNFLEILNPVRSSS